MIQKTKFSFIRALLLQANAADIRIDKRNQQLRYAISSHQFFTWQKEEEFQHFILHTLGRMQKSVGRAQAKR